MTYRSVESLGRKPRSWVTLRRTTSNATKTVSHFEFLQRIFQFSNACCNGFQNCSFANTSQIKDVQYFAKYRKIASFRKKAVTHSNGCNQENFEYDIAFFICPMPLRRFETSLILMRHKLMTYRTLQEQERKDILKPIINGQQRNKFRKIQTLNFITHF